jgi:hypothetical protein
MVDFKFYNANPLGNIESDCVCRAISRALDLPYNTVKNKLEAIGYLFDCEKLCVCCYQHLLEKVFGLRKQYGNGKTVREISKQFNNYIILIRIQGHLTMSEFGTIYDLWDCNDEIVDVFWLIT